MDFQPGDVLRVKWDERPIRVLMSDNIETFYDALLPEIGWNLARVRTAIYYRTATAFLRSSAERLRNDPLTKQERARHRPDLPMRLFQSDDAVWNKPLADWPKIDIAVGIECHRLALIPFGPKGAPLRPVVVEAANGASLTGNELLVAAHHMQVADCPDVEGVGLYRSGISGGIPSYYLWGAINQAGHSR
ncbi:hypothetical protein [Rhodospirillaceae bacterium SYSU D60014]|uniref:hypothetical protein n=1 Tax=Virgifigura deserti TaxID=2268457 RepID=UPI000E661E1B